MQTVRHAFAHGHETRVGNARVHAHSGLEVRDVAGLGARMEAVKCQTASHHVKLDVRVPVRCRRVGRMDNAELETGCLDVRQSLDEVLRLNLELKRLGIVGRRVMRVHALEHERPVEAHLVEELDRIVEPHADAVHAGVDG